VGTTKCPLKKSSDKSGADIKARVEALISKLDAAPQPFTRNHELYVVTGADIRGAFFTPLYSPLKTFKNLSMTLSEALEGNYTRVLDAQGLPHIADDACPLPGSGGGNKTEPVSPDAQAAIACGDGAPITDRDYDGVAEYVGQLKNQSAIFGPRWARITMPCTAWPARGRYRFTGPFTTPPADPSIRAGVPAAPLLFLSNRLDPVTPLVNAYLMAEGHPGSAVVVQESAGHCAIGGGWSECTNEIVRTYLEDGVVPKSGTSCTTECRPFDDEPCPFYTKGGEISAQGMGDYVFPRQKGFFGRPGL